MPINLLANTSRVETPFIKVTIGPYTFGVKDKTTSVGYDVNGVYKQQNIKYPNYVQSLNITKINGQVNQYVLKISYPITDKDDPNFFEKVFSSVSQTRRIEFSYGDLSAANFIYRNEVAIITKVKQQFQPSSSVINYTVYATSTGKLGVAGTYSFPAQYSKKPSEVIRSLLFNKAYGLQDIFPGMRNRTQVEQSGWIPTDDKPVDIDFKANMSILDYLNYLVSCMSPLSSSGSLIKSGVYVMTIIDDTASVGEDYIEEDGDKKKLVDSKGTYFKIVQVDNMITKADAYEIDIGYPSANIVLDFQVEDDETYAIYYNFQEQLNDASYAQRIDDAGNVVDVFAPTIANGTAEFKTTPEQEAWWTKATSYPIKASITLKGLLRPAILMTHVRINMLFYGKKHDTSGLYIITKQVDDISGYGFKTTLNLVRIDKDDKLSLSDQQDNSKPTQNAKQAKFLNKNYK